MTSFNIPDDRHYHEAHLWLRATSVAGEYDLGITQFAQKQLGKILFVELPITGTTIVAGEPFGAVESNKVVSDLVSPISGTILVGNDLLKRAVHLVNEDCYGQGWMVRVKVDPAADLAGLLTAEIYASRFARISNPR
ncbi:MAG: glycine cleavage system protein H [Proteobacteria bacterium]|nr:glycine cleavage system protein H [Pseudomonadota bacterium]